MTSSALMEEGSPRHLPDVVFPRFDSPHPTLTSPTSPSFAEVIPGSPTGSLSSCFERMLSHEARPSRRFRRSTTRSGGRRSVAAASVVGVPLPPPLPILRRQVATFPFEILNAIFLEAGSTAKERKAFSHVCRGWRAPGQAAVWTDIHLERADQITTLARLVSTECVDLARNCRTFSFDPAYPEDNLFEQDVRFDALQLAVHLCGVRTVQLHVLDSEDPTNTNSGFFSQMCQALPDQVTTLDFSCESGTSISHLFAAFRLPKLNDLRIGHLQSLLYPSEDDEEIASYVDQDRMDELRLGEAWSGEPWFHDLSKWPVPAMLTHLTLFKPELSAEELTTLLRVTQNTVTSLNFQFGDAPPGVLETTEDAVEEALMEAGGNILDLTIMWPSCGRFFLDTAIRGCPSCTHVATGGLTCTADMDKNCPPSLRSMTLFVQVGYQAANFQRLWKPGFRVSNVTHYRVITRNTEPLDKLEETWTEARVKEWERAAVDLDKVGINIEGDFFRSPVCSELTVDDEAKPAVASS